MKHLVILFLCWILGSTSVIHAQNHHQTIKHTLQNAGLLVPITSITPSGLDDVWMVSLDKQEPLLITSDTRFVIQGNIENNPSPKVEIAAHLLNTQAAAGTPVSLTYKQALLDNTRQLKNMTADSAFFYTNIPSVLWGVSGKGGTPFLISRDGRKFINGEISSIINGQFAGLDTQFEWQKNRHVLSALDQDTLTIYPAKEQKAVVYVVTDINCPYCRLFHSKIGEFNKQGITVKAIGFNIYPESKESMRQIWCQTDNNKRAALLSAAMKGIKASQHCQGEQNPMQINQRLALPLVFVATPAIYRDDGQLFEGDFTSDEFLQFLAIKAPNHNPK